MISCVGSLQAAITEVSSDLNVLFLAEDFVLSDQLTTKLNKCFEKPEVLLKAHKFTGKKGDSVLLSTVCGDKPWHVKFVGLGKKNAHGVLDFETFRLALGCAIKTAKRLEVDTVALAIPDAASFGMNAADAAQQAVVIAHMATYVFDDFKDIKKQKHPGTQKLRSVA